MGPENNFSTGEKFAGPFFLFSYDGHHIPP